MNKNELALMVDFYELTMAYVYYKQNLHHHEAYFDVFIRSLPNDGGYLIFNGLHKFINFVENFQFTTTQIDYLRSLNQFDEDFLGYLANLKLNLDIFAVPEGTPMFPQEPLMVVKGNLVEAQIIETYLLQCINFSSLIATKAARIVSAASGRAVIEFGARRAQGCDAALEGARAAYLVGCSGTSNTATGWKYQTPVSGTMAHSYIQLFENEYDAFLSYAQIMPDNCIFLVDTYDTLRSGMVNAIKVAQDFLIPQGYQLKGVRLDSGDLAYLSKKARKMLDQAGLNETKILVSNSLDEDLITDLLDQQAEIDIFGVGENLITSKSHPVLGGVYKMVAYQENGKITPVIKISDNVEKVTNPGYKKVYRFYDSTTHKAIADLITLADEVIPLTSYELFDPIATWKRKVITDYYYHELHLPIYQQGKLVYQLPTLAESRLYYQAQMQSLWDEVKRNKFPHRYYVDLSQTLWDLKHQLIEKKRKKGGQ